MSIRWVKKSDIRQNEDGYIEEGGRVNYCGPNFNKDVIEFLGLGGRAIRSLRLELGLNQAPIIHTEEYLLVDMDSTTLADQYRKHKQIETRVNRKYTLADWTVEEADKGAE